MRVYSRFDREFRALHGDWPEDVVDADFEVVDPPPRIIDRSGLSRALGAGSVPGASIADWRAEERRLHGLTTLGLAGLAAALAVVVTVGYLALLAGAWVIGAALSGLPAVFAQGPI